MGNDDRNPFGYSDEERYGIDDEPDDFAPFNASALPSVAADYERLMGVTFDHVWAMVEGGGDMVEIDLAAEEPLAPPGQSWLGVGPHTVEDPPVGHAARSLLEEVRSAGPIDTGRGRRYWGAALQDAPAPNDASLDLHRLIALKSVGVRFSVRDHGVGVVACTRVGNGDDVVVFCTDSGRRIEIPVEVFVRTALPERE